METSVLRTYGHDFAQTKTMCIVGVVVVRREEMQKCNSDVLVDERATDCYEVLKK